jgi:hypothetical protein
VVDARRPHVQNRHSNTADAVYCLYAAAEVDECIWAPCWCAVLEQERADEREAASSDD